MIPDRHGGRLADTWARLRGHDLRIHPAADGQHLRATCADHDRSHRHRVAAPVRPPQREAHVTTQPFALVGAGGYPDGVWTCAWCAAELADGKIRHREDCAWLAEIRAGERERAREKAPVLTIQVEGGEITAAAWDALGRHLETAWQDHAAAVVAAERERIAQLAEQEAAKCDPGDLDTISGPIEAAALRDFADLIREKGTNVNQAEYLGELHQAITEYQGTVRQAAVAYTDAVERAGGILRRRQDAATAAFLGNGGECHDELREVTR